MAIMADNDNVAGMPILNEDCWRETLDHMEIPAILRHRELSVQNKNIVDKYLQGVYGYIMFMPGSTVVIADKKSRVLNLRDARHVRLMLQSFEAHLTRLTTNGNNQWLVEMTGNCRYLKDVTLYHTFWNKELLEFLRSCKHLERVTLRGALWVEDNFTWNLTKLKHIEIDRNERITGSFLEHLRGPLDSLCLRECSVLQGYQLKRCVSSINSLSRLELDECPLEVLGSAHTLLEELPKLQVLSLSHYTGSRDRVDMLAESISKLTDLRELRLRKNDAVDDEFLRKLARGCPRLDTLDVSRCIGSGFYKGVTDAGLAEIIRNRSLAALDVSFLEGLTEHGFTALHSCRRLEKLQATHINQIEDETVFYDCWKHCENLQLLDLRGCDAVSRRLVRLIAEDPFLLARQSLTLLLAGTSYQPHESMKLPKNLTVNMDWPLEGPWERHHNPDPERQVFEHYVNMELGKDIGKILISKRLEGSLLPIEKPIMKMTKRCEQIP